MPKYQLSWIIPLEAKTPEDAVRTFFEMMENDEEFPDEIFNFNVKDVETSETVVLTADEASVNSYFNDTIHADEIVVNPVNTILL